MKRLLLAAAATAATCSLLGACGDDKNEPPASSQSSEPKNGGDAVATVEGPGFTVEMPGEPKRSTQSVKTPAGPVELTFWVVDRGDEAFFMSIGEMPAGVEPDLDGAVDGAASNIDGTVAEKKTAEYHGLPARDARITDADADGEEATVFLRVIGEQDRYYHLQYIAAGGDVRDPPAGYQPFLESLEID